MGQILGQKQKSSSCITHKAGIQGQVGQESNLQPAVLEVAALRPRPSHTVPERSLFLRFHMGIVPYGPVAFHRIAAIFAATSTSAPSAVRYSLSSRLWPTTP